MHGDCQKTKVEVKLRLKWELNLDQSESRQSDGTGETKWWWKCMPTMKIIHGPKCHVIYGVRSQNLLFVFPSLFPSFYHPHQFNLYIFAESFVIHLVIGRGNPRVRKMDPYPYPLKPLPLRRVQGYRKSKPPKGRGQENLYPYPYPLPLPLGFSNLWQFLKPAMSKNAFGKFWEFKILKIWDCNVIMLKISYPSKISRVFVYPPYPP